MTSPTPIGKGHEARRGIPAAIALAALTSLTLPEARAATAEPAAALEAPSAETSTGAARANTSSPSDASPTEGDLGGGASQTSSVALAADEAARASDTEDLDDGALSFRGELVATLLDYELPGHPTIRGRGHVGAIGRATFLWTLDRHASIEAGVLARLPFTLDFEEELGALPVLAMAVRPLGDSRLLLRFGSLDTRHGYHPAVVDEPRYAYGRNYSENYLRSLAPGVVRELTADPHMPAEHGAQLKATLGLLRAEAFVDWQLLETEAHREKFAFGLLAGIHGELGEFDAQLRLVHYGGELFTKGDPVRFDGFDPVRQPLTWAVAGTLRPLSVSSVALEVPAAWIRGRMAQTPGGAPEWHQGVEVGLGVALFDALRLGWRLWLPIDRDFGHVSEDGDPVYSGRRSHRAVLAISTRHGAAELSGRLDLVFADGADKVEYLTVSTLGLRFDELLAGDP